MFLSFKIFAFYLYFNYFFFCLTYFCLSRIFSFFLFSFLGFYFSYFVVYADDLYLIQPAQVPGLLDGLVDHCVSEFWLSMNNGFPCSSNSRVEDHFCSGLQLASAVASSSEDLSFVFPDSVAPDFSSSFKLKPRLVESGADDVPFRIYRFGFEAIPIYLQKSPKVFFFELTFVPGRPTATLLDFSDYMLGRPRSLREGFELLGFALSAFCAGKAMESYCHQHGYLQ